MKQCRNVISLIHTRREKLQELSKCWLVEKPELVTYLIIPCCVCVKDGEVEREGVRWRQKGEDEHQGMKAVDRISLHTCEWPLVSQWSLLMGTWCAMLGSGVRVRGQVCLLTYYTIYISQWTYDCIQVLRDF